MSDPAPSRAERAVSPESATLEGASWLIALRPVLGLLTDGGFEARAVGGAVRDALMGRPVNDADVATTARPEDVLRLAAGAGITAVPTGLAHGTVTLVIGGTPFEVTTLREDIETFGRHARVAFTADWAADARRRDFTINALYCDAAGRVHDPLGGLPDLVARRVRFIGDARERIREDYLRILRFFRFNAAIAKVPSDPDGMSAIIAERLGLARLAGERVRAEFVKLLVAPRAVEVAVEIHDAGLWPLLLGLAPRPALLARLAAIEGRLARPADAMLRLSALAIADRECRHALARRLRLSNDERAGLVVMGMMTGTTGPQADDRADRVACYRLGREHFVRRLMAAWASGGTPTDDTAWRQRIERIAAWTVPQFPIKGRDLIALGVPPGPRVGALLIELEEWWVGEEFQPDAGALTQRLAERVRAG